MSAQSHFDPWRALMTEVLGSQSILERDAASIDSFVKTVTEKPESFAAPSKKLSQQALHMAKTLFDHGMYLNSMCRPYGSVIDPPKFDMDGPNDCNCSRHFESH